MLRFLSALLAFAPLATALAQPTPPEASGEAMTPALYMMEDADSKVYLFGSIHVLDEASYPLPDNVEAAYADAEAIAFEIDMSDIESLRSAILGRAQYAEGRTLQDAMGEDFAKLEARLGPTAQAFSGYEPWAVQFTLVPLAMEGTGFTAASGVDTHFLGRAQADGKERLALETADDQIGIFDSLPETAQVQMLTEMLEEWDTMAETVYSLIAAWKSGDDDEMGALLLDAPEEIRPALFRDRNAKWVPQIEEMLAREGEDVMVVVGAGHLVGEDSVVEMLREKGYTIVRQ